jgi:histidinol dehydrogenase
MIEDRREALLAQAEALMASRGSITDPADRARLRDVMEAIQNELDMLALADLNGAAEACGRAADAVQEVIDVINQHAPQQIAQAVRDSRENLDRLRDPAVV